MASLLNDTLRATIATRIATDYATQGGTLTIKHPNHPAPKNAGSGYIAISYRKGLTQQTSFQARREITPVVIFAQIFAARDAGTKTAHQEADKLCDALRGQTWTVISNTPAGTVPARALDGANPLASIITANLRLHDITADDIGEDELAALYQINVTADCELTVKYGVV